MPCATDRRSPVYNLQIITENQFITDFALFPNPTDTLTLIPFLQSFSNRYDRMAHTVVADSGYGSEENYRFMSENGMEAYVKVQTISTWSSGRDSNRTRSRPKTSTTMKNMTSASVLWGKDAEDRHQECETVSGYVSENARYRAVRCEGCPLRCRCFKAKRKQDDRTEPGT